MRRTIGVALLLACPVVSASCTGDSSEGKSADIRGSGSQPLASSGIVSDRFELYWEVDGTDLLLAVDTDLPDEAELSVSVSRTYFEVGHDAAYARDYFSDVEPVARWRQPRRIPLDANAWKADLAAFQKETASLGPGLAFEVDRIEDDVDIRAVLHLNQDDPRFGGRGNPNLSGQATSRSGTGVLIEAEASFSFPLDGPPPARTSARVAYDGLILVRDESTTGWINSVALMGQQIERAQ